MSAAGGPSGGGLVRIIGSRRFDDPDSGSPDEGSPDDDVRDDAPATASLLPVTPRFARLRRRTRWLPQMLAAAAVVLSLLGAYAMVRAPFTSSGVHQGSALGGGNDEALTATDDEPLTAPRQLESAVSKGFTLVDLTRPMGSTLFGMGIGTCAGAPCPAVVASTNGGRSWVQRHAFASADTSALDDVSRPEVQPDGALSSVWFSSSSTGYVYGGDLWATSDGARSFVHVAHPGTTVLAVRRHAGSVVVLTASGCIQGLCSGRLELSRLTGPASAPTLAQAFAAVTPSTPIASADLVTGDAGLLVVAHGELGTADTPGSWRLADGGSSLVPVAPRSACNGQPLQAVTATSSGFVGLCDMTVSSATTSLSAVSSSDGAMWSLVGSGAVRLPTQGRFSLASQDGTHLVASSGGPREAPDATTRTSDADPVRVSDDGGRTWREPTKQAIARGGLDAVSAWDAHTFVGFSGTEGRYWRSGDAGVTWRAVGLSSAGGWMTS